ncbi:hypothetical protein KAX17_04635, partial [Candidatus Bipolaricaulota bacterium]|nr:hypothetical protein [Candidatus Bipolaricaulota bacterium]
GLNGSSYKSIALDRLLEASAEIVDPALRGEALRLLNKVAMQEKIAIIPLHYQEDSYAIYKGRGISFTPRSDTWIVFKEMSIKK